MICDLQAHCENNVFWRNFKNIPTSCDLKKILSTFYDKFESIAQNNDIISSFDSISLLLIAVIDEIAKFEILLKNVL